MCLQTINNELKIMLLNFTRINSKRNVDFFLKKYKSDEDININEQPEEKTETVLKPE